MKKSPFSLHGLLHDSLHNSIIDSKFGSKHLLSDKTGLLKWKSLYGETVVSEG